MMFYWTISKATVDKELKSGAEIHRVTHAQLNIVGDTDAGKKGA